MTTLTKSDVSRMSQPIDRALRHIRHSSQLAAAKRSGDIAAQLEHARHVADTRIGMAKSPSEVDHWRTVHAEVRELIAEAGLQWRGGRLVDPSRPKPRAMAKSFGVSTAARRMEAATDPAPEYADSDEPIRSLAKSFGSAARAAEYTELRSEVMHSMAKARDERDFDNRLKLIGLRDELTRQAAAEGLGLDDRGRFLPAMA